MDMNEANKKVHPVETQWHYPILTRYGFVPLAKGSVGLVRSYNYEHPETKVRVVCTTWVNSDYWAATGGSASESHGLWGTLEDYLKKNG